MPAERSVCMETAAGYIDKAEPYIELLYLFFEEGTPIPRLRDIVRRHGEMPEGFALYYTNQCPFTVKCEQELHKSINLRSDIMKKKLFIIITGIVLAGIVCIWLLAKNNSAEQMIVNRLNEAVSHYTDMNIKDDRTYSLKVSDTQMLVTTYMPEYTVFGVSTDAYTVRPGQIDETLTTEKEQDLPICNLNYVLIYDEKTDKFYNVKFEGKGKPVMWYADYFYMKMRGNILLSRQTTEYIRFRKKRII